ncbi:hypothetical protein CR513_38522, partial [Mucuna pruriens]
MQSIYHQIKVKDGDIQKIVFRTRYRHYKAHNLNKGNRYRPDKGEYNIVVGVSGDDYRDKEICWVSIDVGEESHVGAFR